MRLFAPIAIAASLATGLPAPASATESTPFPVCQNIYINRQWFGAVCADPAHPRCLVYGGGYVWNMCVINPL